MKKQLPPLIVVLVLALYSLTWAIQTSFNAGEISPALYGRVDLAKYRNGCKVLENFIPLPHGPAERRSGTEFIQEIFGKDRVADGTFDDNGSWVIGTGWSINGTAEGTNGTASYLYEDCNCTEGREYIVEFTAANVTDGNVSAYIGGTTLTARSTNGTFTERAVFGDNDTHVGFYKSANFIGNIDNFSVREVNPTTVLIGFEFSVVQAYVLEFTEKQIRFYKDGGIILDDNGDPYILETPYLEDDLDELHTTQSADVLYIAHKNYKPKKLLRYGHSNWELADITFLGEPRRVITGADCSDPIKIYCPDHQFINGDYVYIDEVEGMTEINGGGFWVENSTDSTFELRGMDGSAYSGYTGGGYALEIRAYITNATQTDPVKITLGNHRFANGDRIRIAGVIGMVELNDNVYTVAGRTEDTFELKGVNGTGYTAYITGGFASPWVELFDDDGHYPSSVEFFEERLIWAATTDQPQTIFGSRTEDYENMGLGVNDDNAFAYTIASRGVNSINWIVPTDKLIIGTKGGEWLMRSSSAGEPITPTNVNIKRQSAWGSDDTQAALVNDAVLFVQRGGTKIREFVYSFEKDGYVAPDLTVLAEHITEGGITCIAYQQEPYPILWAVRSDGVLLSMVYDRSQNVVGWSRQVLDGSVRYVAVIVGAKNDETWVTVEREIDGSPRLYMERIGSEYVDSYITWSGGGTTDITNVSQASEAVVTAPGHLCEDGDHVRMLGVEGMTELNEVIYIVSDSNATGFKIKDDGGSYIDTSGYEAYTGGGTIEVVAKKFSGLDHLIGEDVTLLGDRCALPDETVDDSGEIELEDYVGELVAGIGYRSILETVNLESEIMGETPHGDMRRIHELLIRFKDSQACWIGTPDGDWQPIPFRDDGDPMDEPIPQFTGDKRINVFPGAYSTEVTVKLMAEEPYPLTVVSLFPQFRKVR